MSEKDKNEVARVPTASIEYGEVKNNDSDAMKLAEMGYEQGMVSFHSLFFQHTSC